MYSTPVSLCLPPASPPSFRAQRCPPSRQLPPPPLHAAATSKTGPLHLPSFSGLRTPPGDCTDPTSAMGTTYQPPPSAAYEDRHGPSFPPAYASSSLLAEADRKRSILSELTNSATLNRGSSSSSSNSMNSRVSGITYTAGHGPYGHPTVAATSGQQQQQQIQNYMVSRQLQSQSDASVGASLPLPSASSASASASASISADHESSAHLHVPSAYSYAGSARLPSTPTKATPTAAVAVSAVPSTRLAEPSPVLITDQDAARMVVHSLEIPKCISPRGGSLSNFTAELTCLFWFEWPAVYQQAENAPPKTWGTRLSQNAFPNANFKTWVNRMLTTTQVTQNVVFLALLFIYRLKKLNPTVRGKPGSEFRLLTVALMLGNKFLDDNTYTNKTWSDVSSLNVKDIHVMEVEFLSNMRYGLLVSADEWKEWLGKLAKFRIFYDRMSTLAAAGSASTSPHASHSPQHSFTSPVPSPTSTLHSVSGIPLSASFEHSGFSPPSKSAYQQHQQQQQQQQRQWTAPFPGAQALSPLAARQELNSYGKRMLSHDDPTEPLPKRIVRPGQQQMTSTLPPAGASLGSVMPPLSSTHLPAQADPFNTAAVLARPSLSVSDAMRLPVPHLTLNTNAASTATTQAPATAPPAGSFQLAAAPLSHTGQPSSGALSLPPLTHGMRAMATVFPSANNGAGGQPVLVNAGPLSGPVSGSLSGPPPKLSVAVTGAPSVMGTPMSLAPGGTTPTAFVAPTFGTPTKRMSPMSALTPSAASAYAAATTSSPLTESFPHMSAVHTPISHSPSVYLQQRASPYRPIRNVHMLLNPPPSSSLQDYQAASNLLIPPAQMYYQPLGRRNDLRSGIVPEFQGMQYGASMRPGFDLAHSLQHQHQAIHQMHAAQGVQTMSSISSMTNMSSLSTPLRDAHGQPVSQHLHAPQYASQQQQQQQQQQQRQLPQQYRPNNGYMN